MNPISLKIICLQMFGFNTWYTKLLLENFNDSNAKQSILLHLGIDLYSFH